MLAETGRPFQHIELGGKLQALTEASAWTFVEDSGLSRPFTIGEPDLLARLFVYRVAPITL